MAITTIGVITVKGWGTSHSLRQWSFWNNIFSIFGEMIQYYTELTKTNEWIELNEL